MKSPVQIIQKALFCHQPFHWTWINLRKYLLSPTYHVIICSTTTHVEWVVLASVIYLDLTLNSFIWIYYNKYIIYIFKYIIVDSPVNHVEMYSRLLSCNQVIVSSFQPVHMPHRSAVRIRPWRGWVPSFRRPLLSQDGRTLPATAVFHYKYFVDTLVTNIQTWCLGSKVKHVYFEKTMLLKIISDFIIIRVELIDWKSSWLMIEVQFQNSILS